MDHSNVEKIKNHWDEKAKTLTTQPEATMGDLNLREMEISAISSRLNKKESLIDIGCGNAYGSLKFSQHCKDVLAMDYSEKMIQMANLAIKESQIQNIRAEVGDVQKVGDIHHREFDAATLVRCLINLPTEEQQYGAIDQIGRSLKHGGRLLLLEGIQDGLDELNRVRGMFSLYPIKRAWHNLFFDRQKLEDFLQKHFVVEEVVDFGEYYFISRVLNALLALPEEPKFDSKLNSIAHDVWRKGVASNQFKDMSILLLYVCKIS